MITTHANASPLSTAPATIAPVRLCSEGNLYHPPFPPRPEAEDAAVGEVTEGKNLGDGSPEQLFADLEGRREKLRRTRAEVRRERHEIAGGITALVAALGTEEAIQSFAAEHGVAWPQENAVHPAYVALVRHFMYPDDDPQDVAPRISEWARAIAVLIRQGHVGEQAAAFLEEHGSVRGVYGSFDSSGNPKGNTPVSGQGLASSVAGADHHASLPLGQPNGTSEIVFEQQSDEAVTSCAAEPDENEEEEDTILAQLDDAAPIGQFMLGSGPIKSLSLMVLS